MTIAQDADVIIIGAGPAGLFASFQLGIHGFSSLIVESDRQIGGQLAALYADKPVYDMPGFSEILAGALADNLLRQAERFRPVIRLSSRARAIVRHPDSFSVDLADGETLHAGQVIIATGLGAFGDTVDKEPVILPGGLVLDAGHLPVTTDSFATAVPGLYGIGDAVRYPGKLALLSSAFHEAALAAFAIRKARAGGKRVVLEYSSTSSAVKSRLG